MSALLSSRRPAGAPVQPGQSGKKTAFGRNRKPAGLWFTVAVLAAAELMIRAGVLPGSSFPPPTVVFLEFFHQLANSNFWLVLWHTVSASMLGLLIVAAIATPVALLIGLSRLVRESTWVIVEFLKPIPPVALIPLGLILWGPSPAMKLFLIVFGAVWPLLTQMVYGIREVSGVALDMSRSYRLGRWLTISRVVLPSMLPFAATGLRVSAAIAIVISVVTEMVGGVAGLGQSITVAQTANAVAEMYALILTAGLLGLGINGLFKIGERIVLFWHPSQREGKS
jgi:ABC-type nitrate/sulfonate/bicarbonate transport system permease component